MDVMLPGVSCVQVLQQAVPTQWVKLILGFMGRILVKYNLTLMSSVSQRSEYMFDS